MYNSVINLYDCIFMRLCTSIWQKEEKEIVLWENILEQMVFAERRM